MKIFVLGHPHTKTHPDFLHHGFTTKVWNLCSIYASLGHEVIHLGVEGSSLPSPCKNVDVLDHALWEKAIGPDAHRPPAAPISADESKAIETKRAEAHEAFARNANEAIRSRCSSPYEAIVAVTWGGFQWAATKGLDQFVVEAGIGYYPQTRSRFRVFESQAWAHLIHGKELTTKGDYWEEAVIPNASDPSRFRFSAKKDGYFLCLGRMNDDKGIGIAVQVSKTVGKKLILAGTPGPAVASVPDGVEFRPNVSEKERADLLAGADALIAATRYPEPFGAVAVEAQLSGTPVIATDWGAFPETVLHGITGFRCRTFDQFLRAARAVGDLDPHACRTWAEQNFTLQAVAPAWDEYFRSLMNLNTAEGWYKTSGALEAGAGRGIDWRPAPRHMLWRDDGLH